MIKIGDFKWLKQIIQKIYKNMPQNNNKQQIVKVKYNKELSFKQIQIRIMSTNQTLITQTQIQCQRLQQDQFQILSYIYLDEFQIIKQHYPYKFSIQCRPYVKTHQFEYQLNLHFEFTKSYPKNPLRYQIEPVTGITRDNMNQITKIIEDFIYQNRDKPIVYDIIEEIRFWIFQYLVQGKAYQSYEEVEKKAEEVYERPKFSAFTPVTEESFNTWKKEFDAKYKAKKVEKKQGQAKLSGKQWFLGKKEDQIQQSDQEYSDQEDQEEQQEAPREYVQPQNKLFMDQEETAQVN